MYRNASKTPLFKSPLDAFSNGPREKLMYVTCPQLNSGKPDYLATVDLDPESPTYSQVVHRTHLLENGDEIHHSGWNACSSCPALTRSHLILPCLHSSRIYIVNVVDDPRAPNIQTTIEPQELFKLDLSFPHTSHCLPNGTFVVSSLGDKDGNGKGNFLVADAKTFKVKGTWADKSAPMGYDYWYQPHFNVLLSSEWGCPNHIKQGFNPDDVNNGFYGHSMNLYEFRTGKLRQRIDFEKDTGSMPLEVRFLHDPAQPHAFVGTALGSSIYHIYRKENDQWAAEKVIEVKPKKVSGWLLPDMPAVITDILISLDDRYLYFSCWVHGDLRQYDITDPSNPRLVGQIFLGGSLCKDVSVTVTEDPENIERPQPLYFGEKRVDGGPQMLQLSLDGRRLYVTTSLYTRWDKQFYPDIYKSGAKMLKVNVDRENGGLTLDRDFLVDFGAEPDGPVLAHEMRYPGGDCSSDIWLTPEQMCHCE